MTAGLFVGGQGGVKTHGIIYKHLGRGVQPPLGVQLGGLCGSLVILYYLDNVKTMSGQGRAALAQSRITQVRMGP